MTVKELIEKLKEYPEDMQVVTNDHLGMFNIEKDCVIITTVAKSSSNFTNLPEGTKVLAL